MKTLLVCCFGEHSYVRFTQLYRTHSRRAANGRSMSPHGCRICAVRFLGGLFAADIVAGCVTGVGMSENFRHHPTVDFAQPGRR